MVASGPEFDCRFLEDLMEETTLFTCLEQPASMLDCFTLSLRELHARGVNLFFCLDHDGVYKRGYIESVCDFVRASGVDVEEGLFCLNLIDQQWVTLYDDARADLEARSFRSGLGLSPEEAKRVVVGAPPTFVFGRGAAQIVIERADREGGAPDVYQDIFWRRALLDAGIRITQVQTPEPVFAYVRHSNNLCWGGRPVGAYQTPPANANAVAPASPRISVPVSAVRHEVVDVSVVVPTYNEGAWLTRTVDAIRAAINDLRCEIVVVDDGCTDGSLQTLAPGGDLRIVKTGGEQLGLIVAKNTGAKAARGRYLCFLDSHMLAHDHWLDYLRETCDAYPDGALVSGNLPDVARVSDKKDREQYGYIIRNCLLGTGWHYYGNGRMDQPYLTPLTPGGLMFTRKLHFARLGGFESSFRKWGAEDIQISLHNYYAGGENVVDPRVIVPHYYKGGKNSRRTFTVTNAQHGFNCLHVAALYFPREYYLKVREALAARGGAIGFIEEIEADDYQRRLERTRPDFIRGFVEWTTRFAKELRKFLSDAEGQPAGSTAAGRSLEESGQLAVAGRAR
jgi:glycosyltransferase involved in cell wall biosynthesis